MATMSERRGDELVDELRTWRVVPGRFQHWVATRPDGPFVCCGGEWLSFAEMARRSDAHAGALARLGAIQVPMKIFLKGEFLRYQLQDSHTADYVRQHADGFFVDRKKDAMRHRGENISSIELEAAIARHSKMDTLTYATSLTRSGKW